MKDTTYFRKAAFAVGFGLTMGKFVGELVKAGINGGAKCILRHKAKEGDKIAQDVCEKANIEYETMEKENDEPRAKIGFHC